MERRRRDRGMVFYEFRIDYRFGPPSNYVANVDTDAPQTALLIP